MNPVPPVTNTVGIRHSFPSAGRLKSTPGLTSIPNFVAPAFRRASTVRRNARTEGGSHIALRERRGYGRSQESSPVLGRASSAARGCGNNPGALVGPDTRSEKSGIPTEKKVGPEESGPTPALRGEIAVAQLPIRRLF